MGSRPLRLGKLAPEQFAVSRSAVRWLKKDGEACEAGDLLAFCNLGRLKDSSGAMPVDPFLAEGEGLQVALLAPLPGRVRHDNSPGGLIEIFDHVFQWAPDLVIGALEVDGTEDAEPLDVGLLMLAARTRSRLVEQRYAPLAGWHDRTRAWRADHEGEIHTLVGQALCQLSGMLLGSSKSYAEFFQRVGAGCHVVYGSRPPATPSSAVMLGQLRRTSAERAAIAADLISGVTGGPEPVSPADLIYTAILQTALTAPSLLTETYPILTRAGLSRVGPAETVLLTANGEEAVVYRHKTLGYDLQLLPWQEADGGSAVRGWLTRSFERRPRSLDEVRLDYVALIDEVRARAAPGRRTRFVIMNAFSTWGPEDVQSYAGFDDPMGATLETIRFKDINLMLRDLARERDIAILDFDALGAELGGGWHMPDSVHPTELLMAEGRIEIARILEDHKAVDFAVP